MQFRVFFLLQVLFLLAFQLRAQVNCPPNLPLTLVGNTSYCIGSPGSELSIDQSYVGYEWLPTPETTQSVLLTAGNYQVVVTHYTGCTDTLSFLVEQVSNPPQPIIDVSGPTQFCEGESVVLSVSGSYPYYEWNTGSVTDEITVFESGTFVVSVVDWIGCASSSNSIQVIVDPLPSAAFSPALDQFDISFDNLSLDASDYEWNFGDGTFSTDFEPSHTYSTGGAMTMWLVAFNDCGSDTAFLDLASVGIEDLGSIAEFNIFPNPSIGNLTVQFSSSVSDIVTISLYDAFGRWIRELNRQMNVGLNSMVWDLSEVSAGMYLLSIDSDQGRATTRVIIENHH